MTCKEIRTCVYTPIVRPTYAPVCSALGRTRILIYLNDECISTRDKHENNLNECNIKSNDLQSVYYKIIVLHPKSKYGKSQSSKIIKIDD